MASRPILTPHKVITDGTMSSATLTGTPTIIPNTSQVGYQFTWAGNDTAAGNLGVQISNNYALNADGTVRNSGDWVDLTLSSTPTATGASGSAFIDITACSAYAIRPKYTRTASGAGVLQCYVNGKVS